MAGPTFPFRDAVVDGTAFQITTTWRIWLRNLYLATTTQATRLAAVTLTKQTASIPATPFNTASLSAGSYRVSLFLHVTTPGSISSSLTPSIGFTHAAIPCTLSGPALTTNLTTSVASAPFFFRWMRGRRSPGACSMPVVPQAWGMP